MYSINGNVNNIFNKRFIQLVEEDKTKNKIKTDKEFANRIGIKPQSLAYYLKGRLPDTLQLIKISNYFDVSLQYLVGISDNKNYKNFQLGKDFNLSDEVQQNLKVYKNDELMVYTINLLLGNKGNELLTAISDYITTPSENNPYLNLKTDNLEKDIYINIYKIWKLLEQLSEETKKSEKIAEMYYHNAGDIIEEQEHWNGD
ncbi:plasmid maintenance system antidote protein [Mycoplasma sp. CAG:776]|nr:plasmid maintenance system antidote protein [Mycoplasma sp. CAG:776]